MTDIQVADLLHRITEMTEKQFMYLTTKDRIFKQQAAHVLCAFVLNDEEAFMRWWHRIRSYLL